MLESASSTAIPTTNASDTSGPVYVNEKELLKLVMIDKARRAKHVSSILLNKFCTTTIRKEKVRQKKLLNDKSN